MTFNAIEFCASRLAPGDTLIRKSDGLRLIKCADQWHHYKTGDHTFFDCSQGLILHISEIVDCTLTEDEFRQQFELCQ